MKINEIISERRKSLGLTQKELSAKVGIRLATISEFESGKHGLGSDKLELILSELQLSIQPVTADAGGEKENKTAQTDDVDYLHVSSLAANGRLHVVESQLIPPESTH